MIIPRAGRRIMQVYGMFQRISLLSVHGAMLDCVVVQLIGRDVHPFWHLDFVWSICAVIVVMY